MPERITYTCRNCKWHDNFSWVCLNGDSEYAADFTDDGDTCDKWEREDGRSV